MGVVQRQSVKQSVVTFLGMLLGAANIILIYPYSFDAEQFGIVQFVIKCGTFFIPVALLGAHIVAINFFPRFKDETSGNHGFLGLLMLMSVITTALLMGVMWLFRGQIASFYGEKSDYFAKFLPYILPLIALTSFSYLLTVYASNFQRIVVPSIYFNLLSKMTLPVLALAVGFGYLQLRHFFDGLILTYVVVLAGLWLYIRHLGQSNLRIDTAFLTPELRTDVRQYYLYNSLFGIGFTIVTQVDALFVGSMIDLSSVAIFSIGYFLAEAMDTPRKAIFTIVGPLIAGSMQRGDMNHVEELYQKSGLNAVIPGLLLLLGTWVCADGLFAIMPKGEFYAEGKLVILILGLGRITDMLASLNYEIINYSRFYRFHVPAVVLVSVIGILLNRLLIPAYGYHGAAMATLGSLVLYNLLKGGFIWWKFGIQPLRPASFAVLAVAAAVGVAFQFLPHLSHPIADILVRGTLVSVLFMGIVWMLRLSPDLNLMVGRFIGKLTQKA